MLISEKEINEILTDPVKLTHTLQADGMSLDFTRGFLAGLKYVKGEYGNAINNMR